MTAMLTLDPKPNLKQELAIQDKHVDTVKGTRSKLKIGTQLTREEMLRLALMASENLVAAALSRYCPEGWPAYVPAMNRKATDWGLSETHFEDSPG